MSVFVMIEELLKLAEVVHLYIHVPKSRVTCWWSARSSEPRLSSRYQILECFQNNSSVTRLLTPFGCGWSIITLRSQVHLTEVTIISVIAQSLPYLGKLSPINLSSAPVIEDQALKGYRVGTIVTP